MALDENLPLCNQGPLLAYWLTQIVCCLAVDKSGRYSSPLTSQARRWGDSSMCEEWLVSDDNGPAQECVAFSKWGGSMQEEGSCERTTA